MHRANVGEQIQLFSQRYVDARESAADGRGDRTLQSDARALQTVENMLRQRLAGLGDDLGIQLYGLPLNRNTGGVDGAARSGGYFRANAIARNQSDGVRHTPILRVFYSTSLPMYISLTSAR